MDEKFNGVTLKYTIDIDKNASNSQTNGTDSKKGVEWDTGSLDGLGWV